MKLTSRIERWTFGCLLLLAVLCALECQDVRPARELPYSSIVGDLAWSADGSGIYYVADTTPGQLWFVDTLGNRHSCFRAWPYATDSPSISSDGRRLLFEGNDLQIYVADLFPGDSVNESSIRMLTDTGENHLPNWSPDGDMIAYHSDMGHDSTGYYGICIMRSDGSGKHRVDGTYGDACNPSWSPDGSRFVYIGYARGKEAVMIMDTGGRMIREVTHDLLAHRDPAWSPTPDTIAFVTGRADDRGMYVRPVIELSDTLGRRFEELITGHRPAWSPDGKKLAYMGVEPDWKYWTLFIMDIESRQTRQMVFRKGEGP